ncbi:MAG: SAM-dependent methyltransferase [archaeon]
MFVIEHMDGRLYKWSELEYRHISAMAGKENVMFTNLTSAQCRKLAALGKTETKSATELNLKNACLLDPSAKKTLTAADDFDYYIVGGVLGDDPPRERTKQELGPHFPSARNLGKKQFSTDTAVLVAGMILNGTPLNKIRFADGLEIEISETDSTTFPFRYVIINDEPVITPGLVEYLRKRPYF